MESWEVLNDQINAVSILEPVSWERITGEPDSHIEPISMKDYSSDDLPMENECKATEMPKILQNVPENVIQKNQNINQIEQNVSEVENGITENTEKKQEDSRPNISTLNQSSTIKQEDSTKNSLDEARLVWLDLFVHCLAIVRTAVDLFASVSSEVLQEVLQNKKVSKFQFCFGNF